MAVYAIQNRVQWRGQVPNESGGFVRPAHGVVLHIMDGTLWGTDGWFHNAKAQASSDYGVGKDGTILWWVDWTRDWKAWAEAAGNPYWVSIECEGVSGDVLTAAQLESVAQIVAYVFTLDNVPFQLTDNVTGKGLGWHGMGGAAWGGHTNCPGPGVLGQRQQILNRAQQLANAGSPSPAPYNPPANPTFPGELDVIINPTAKTDFLSCVEGGVTDIPDPRAGWEVHADGGIENVFGAPFWGGYFNLPATNRNAPRVFLAVCPRRDGLPGYEIDSVTDAAYFSFGPDTHYV